MYGQCTGTNTIVQLSIWCHISLFQFADENEINFFEVSAKNRNNVDKVNTIDLSSLKKKAQTHYLKKWRFYHCYSAIILNRNCIAFMWFPSYCISLVVWLSTVSLLNEITVKCFTCLKKTLKFVFYQNVSNFTNNQTMLV